jgi:hypothetical protein
MGRREDLVAHPSGGFLFRFEEDLDSRFRGNDIEGARLTLGAGTG